MGEGGYTTLGFIAFLLTSFSKISSPPLCASTRSTRFVCTVVDAPNLNHFVFIVVHAPRYLLPLDPDLSRRVGVAPEGPAPLHPRRRLDQPRQRGNESSIWSEFSFKLKVNKTRFDMRITLS